METRIAIFVVALFAVVAALIAVLGMVDGGGRKPGRLWRLYLVQILIVGFILSPAYFGGAVELVALLALVARAQYEFMGLHGRPASGGRELTAQLAGLAAVASAYLIGPGMATALIAITAVLLLVGCRAASDGPAQSGAVAAAGLLLPAALVAHLALLVRLENGFAWLALVYILVETNDSFAYLFGKAFGKHHILPRLSPGKTAEGLVAGLLSAILVGLVLNEYAYGLPLAVLIGAIAVIVGGGVLGDLATSAVKRRQGRKDFPTVLEAHGGVLDIYDSLLLAVPLFHLYHRWALS